MDDVSPRMRKIVIVASEYVLLLMTMLFIKSFSLCFPMLATVQTANKK